MVYDEAVYVPLHVNRVGLYTRLHATNHSNTLWSSPVVEKKTIPQHVVEQRAAGASKKLRPRREKSEFYDVFRRINMHDGDKAVCWEWRGAHGKGTRGEYRPRVVVGQRDYYVHRIVYQLYTGYNLETKDVIRHQCDNAWCCNPYHMLIGTQADNVRDMLDRERVGMKLFHVKRIMQMLELGCTAQYVSEKMKHSYDMQLDVSMIRKIRMRTMYKHVAWPWGDQYADKRRKRLDDVKRHKLASVSECDIILDATKPMGDKHDTSKDEEQQR